MLQSIRHISSSHIFPGCEGSELIFVLLFFCLFDTCWFKFGSGTPPSVSGTINSTGFRPSFVQFRQIFAIFDQFLDINSNFLTSLRPKMRVLRAYDCWSIGPRVSELKVKACDGVLTVLLSCLIRFGIDWPFRKLGNVAPRGGRAGRGAGGMPRSPIFIFLWYVLNRSDMSWTSWLLPFSLDPLPSVPRLPRQN